MPDELVITVSLHCRGEGEGRERGVQERREGREGTGRGYRTGREHLPKIRSSTIDKTYTC